MKEKMHWSKTASPRKLQDTLLDQIIYFESEGTEKYPKHPELVVYADLEIHQDGSLHLDGMGFKRGESVYAHIEPGDVDNFLSQCTKLHKRLKEKKLLPKAVPHA